MENRYALALFELTQNEEGLRARGSVAHRGTLHLWKALLKPCIPAVEKDRVLCRLLGQGDDPVLLSFFRLLCRRERLSLLPAVVERYHQLKLKAEGGAQGVFTCAREPSPEDLERIGKALQKRHGLSKVEFQVVVDPQLLGGFVIQLEGVTYDKSVRSNAAGPAALAEREGISFERQTGRNRIHTERRNFPVRGKNSGQ